MMTRGEFINGIIQELEEKNKNLAKENVDLQEKLLKKTNDCSASPDPLATAFAS